MDFRVRPMRREDVPQVNKIDHEAFPGWWPTTNYEHELENRLTHFIVVYESGSGNDITAVESEASSPEEKGLSKLTSRIREFLNYSGEAKSSDKVVGFAGFWIMAGEAHVMSIAVKSDYRLQGIGELLMLSVIDMALALRTELVTLEVRVSNYGAQSLYRKLGFRETGIRHGYYTDNKEDACVMSTDNIETVPFQSHLKKLKKHYLKRWGNRFCETLV